MVTELVLLFLGVPLAIDIEEWISKRLKSGSDQQGTVKLLSIRLQSSECEAKLQLVGPHEPGAANRKVVPFKLFFDPR